MSDREELLAAANAVRLAVGVLRCRIHDEWISGVSPSETAVLPRLNRSGPLTSRSSGAPRP